jgi:hypothetical protein
MGARHGLEMRALPSKKKSMLVMVAPLRRAMASFASLISAALKARRKNLGPARNLPGARGQSKEEIATGGSRGSPTF